MSRTRLIIASSFAGSLGWGTILPFQYAYVVNTRGWGALAGVLTGTAFCLGAIVAAPMAGRLTDRYSARSLAVAFPLAAAVACLVLGASDSATQFLVAMAVFGAVVTASWPPAQVLVLEAVPAAERRAVFAYQFTAMALGMAVGAFAAGWVIDLRDPDGMWPAFTSAAVGFAVSALLLTRIESSPGTAITSEPAITEGRGDGRGTIATYLHLARNRQVRLLGLVSIALAAGFYAQFETGLPAFALQSLDVPASTIGTAAAVNCAVIVALQWLIVRVTGKHNGALLLGVVASIWVGCWLLLEVALFTSPGTAGAIFTIAFGLFAVGETMYAPVISPMAAQVAPPGLVGTTIGALSGLRTGISAAGPLVAGVLIALNLPHVFVLLHVVINLTAAVLAYRLLHVLRADEVANGEREKVRPTLTRVPGWGEQTPRPPTRIVELDGGYVLEVAA